MPPDDLGLQTPLESVNLIDAGGGAALGALGAQQERGPASAELLLTAGQTTAAGGQGGPGAEGIPLITKQVFKAIASGHPCYLPGPSRSSQRAQLGAEAVSEAGVEVARLLLSPSVQRDVLREGLDPQPYHPQRSNLRLLAAKGLECRVDSLARLCVLTLCTSPFPTPQGGDRRWRSLNIYCFGSDIAQVQSQLLGHLQRLSHRPLRLVPTLPDAPAVVTAGLFLPGLGLGLVQSYMEQYQLEADT
ncbi:Hypothetical predicted protein [Marmota monax]|uniref:Histidine N-acetyltransferase C-terminal domain-containing protein n=1 Tax=Marmota monax TaxID=9995 RepID=A0A5E4CLP2_MARMO|nr:Hypothetical predicted protein [Marmota monax]